MTSRSAKDDLDRQAEKLEKKLPHWAARTVRWLREPSSKWVRMPAALLLIACGVLGFLPILGFWMVPLGLMLVAQDVPFLRGPLASGLRWIERKWQKRKR